MENYLSINEVADYLGYSISQVYQNWRKWVANGLRVYMIGPTPRFRKEDIDKWMDSRNKLQVKS